MTIRRGKVESNSYEQLERGGKIRAMHVIQSHLRTSSAHILSDLLRGATQALKGVRDPYTETMRGLSIINICGFKMLMESFRYS